MDAFLTPMLRTKSVLGESVGEVTGQEKGAKEKEQHQ
jgi:hypothetical protein